MSIEHGKVVQRLTPRGWGILRDAEAEVRGSSGGCAAGSPPISGWKKVVLFGWRGWVVGAETLSKVPLCHAGRVQGSWKSLIVARGPNPS